MSRLDQLLEGVEVEWKTLGEVVEIQRGRRLVRNQLSDSGDYAVYQNSMSPLGYYNESNVAASTTFVISAGAAGEIGYSNVRFWAADDVYFLNTPTNSIANKYVYYFLMNQQGRIKGQVRRASIPRLSKSVIEKLLIPIPPLAVQEEIVRILDVFTELTAELTTELTTELTGRTKQYNYYREQLFTFAEGEVEWKTLGEVAFIGTGSRNTNEAVDNGEYDFFVRSQTSLKINEFEFDETAIITAGDGVGVGKVFHYVQGKYALHQRAYRIVVKDKQIVNPKFLFFFFCNNFYGYIMRTSVHSSVASLRKPMFENYPIPIPPLEEQARIVSILDKFDVLTTSIREGLPKEIQLRKKQYEYYRDKLLTFPREK